MGCRRGEGIWRWWLCTDLDTDGDRLLIESLWVFPVVEAWARGESDSEDKNMKAPGVFGCLLVWLLWAFIEEKC